VLKFPQNSFTDQIQLHRTDGDRRRDGVEDVERTLPQRHDQNRLQLNLLNEKSDTARAAKLWIQI
jgi:hypothetical protein